MKNLSMQKKDVQEIVRRIEASPNDNGPERLKTLKALLKEANRENNPTLTGFCHAYLARYYYTHNDFERTNREIRKGLPIQEQCGDTDSLEISYNLLGIDAMNHGDYAIALDYFDHTLHNTKASEKGRGVAYANIGHIYYEVGDISRAIDYCKKSRKIIAGTNDMLNLILVIGQETTFDIWAHRIRAAAKLIRRLEVLMESYCRVHPEYHYSDLDEVLIYYYDTIGDQEKRDQAMQSFMDHLRETPASLDYAENVFWISDTMMNACRPNATRSLLDMMRDTVMNSGVHHMELEFLERDIRCARLLGEEERVQRLLAQYYEINLLLKHENVRVYRMNVDVQREIRDLQEEKQEMEEENRHLLEEATMDALTGIPNRALLNQKSEELFREAKLNRTNLGVEMLDVDHFKEFNDTFGHQEGDLCLKQVALVLKSVSDSRTFVARYGGDEFMVIYSGMTDEEIMEKADSIRAKLLDLKIENPLSGAAPFVTVSQGIRNSVPKESNKVWDYTYAADNALYQVKRTKKGSILLLHQTVFDEKVLSDAIRK